MLQEGLVLLPQPDERGAGLLELACHSALFKGVPLQRLFKPAYLLPQMLALLSFGQQFPLGLFRPYSKFLNLPSSLLHLEVEVTQLLETALGGLQANLQTVVLSYLLVYFLSQAALCLALLLQLSGQVCEESG